MIVLDTHAWVWWLAAPERLRAPTRRLIQAALSQGELIISSISTWEVAMLASRGRLAFSLDVQEWINQSEQISGLRFIAVDNKIAYRAVSLPDPFHADPADRIIVATARQLDATLVTNDEKIRAYSHVRTMW